MISGKKTALFFLTLVSICVSAVAADSVIVQYVKSGPNGGFPFETLKVYQSATAELITATFNSSSTVTYSMTPVELSDLIKLFTDNNFSALDSSYQSGCLACPVWTITYGQKKVTGNTTGSSVPLANIKAGLDALVMKIKDSALVIAPQNSSTSRGNVSASFRAKLNLNGHAGRSGVVVVRDGFRDAYTVSGQRTILER
jgi:hypothetical protein